MVTDPQEPARLGRELGAEGGGLDGRLGIEFIEVSAARVVARMPVEGNTQVYGTLHGGASSVDAAGAFLAARGAGEVPHPGGTLLAHLRRVHALLSEWQARPALRLAGLCHAFYGTDGFATALGEVTERNELAAVIGEEAERLVYLYAGCEREFSYPRLPGGPFRDRFTGTEFDPPARTRRDIAELTAANELDLARVNEDFRAAHGQALLTLFTSWRTLLSDRAWQCVRDTLS